MLTKEFMIEKVRSDVYSADMVYEWANANNIEFNRNELRELSNYQFISFITNYCVIDSNISMLHNIQIAIQDITKVVRKREIYPTLDIDEMFIRKLYKEEIVSYVLNKYGICDKLDIVSKVVK